MAENTVSLYFYNFNPFRYERPRKFLRTYNHFNLQFNTIELQRYLTRVSKADLPPLGELTYLREDLTVRNPLHGPFVAKLL